MKTFKSYDQLWKRYVERKDFKGQLTAQKIINGRACGPNGWEDFKLTPCIRNQVAKGVTETIGGRKQEKIERLFAYCIHYNNSTLSHWALDRLILNKRSDNTYYWTYCAGQDYPKELGELRKYLYSL